MAAPTIAKPSQPRPPKSSSSAPNGKAKDNAATAASTPAEPSSSSNGDIEIAKLSGGRPDQAAHKAEMDKIQKQIDEVQAKVTAVRQKIGSAGNARDSPVGQKRAELRAELDKLRNEQAGGKASRGKVLDELKALQDGIQKKIKDLQAAKGKAPFKSIAEVDAQIAHLEQQVESGSMKLVDERRTLSEISQLKKSRKTVEGFAAAQQAIDAERAKVDELRAKLDDPSSRATSDRFTAINAELDALNKEADALHASRGQLLDERTALSKRLDELYGAKRDRNAAYRVANDKYWEKVNEEKSRRIERQRAERQAAEEAKKKEEAARMREEAAMPAFATQIEDCDNLINYFSGKPITSSSSGPLLSSSSTVPQREVRKVDDSAFAGAKMVKKKGEEEEAYFVGSGKKGGKGKKGNTGGAGSSSAKKGVPLPLNGENGESGGPTTTGEGKLNVPLPTLSALLNLSIPPPTSAGDLPQTIENLKLKKAYFVANQDRVTKENIERVEKLLAKNGAGEKAAKAEESADKVAADEKVEDAKDKVAEETEKEAELAGDEAPKQE